MAWLTIDRFKKLFVDTANVSDERLQMCLDASVDEILVLVGQTAIDDVALPTPLDAIRTARLVRAQGYLAYRNLLLNVSGRMRDAGIVKSEQDAGSPAGGGGGTVINSYMMPIEVGELRDQLWADAMTAIAQYVTQPTGQDNYDASPESYHPAAVEDCCRW